MLSERSLSNIPLPLHTLRYIGVPSASLLSSISLASLYSMPWHSIRGRSSGVRMRKMAKSRPNDSTNRAASSSMISLRSAFSIRSVEVRASTLIDSSERPSPDGSEVFSSRTSTMAPSMVPSSPAVGRRTQRYSGSPRGVENERLTRAGLPARHLSSARTKLALVSGALRFESTPSKGRPTHSFAPLLMMPSAATLT